MLSHLTVISQWVISSIESMLEHIVDGLLEDRDQLSFTLRSRGGTKQKNLDPNRKVISPSSKMKERQLNFPGSSPEEAWRFS
jgi:meiotic recombination protein SPO11